MSLLMLSKYTNLVRWRNPEFLSVKPRGTKMSSTDIHR